MKLAGGRPVGQPGAGGRDHHAAEKQGQDDVASQRPRDAVDQRFTPQPLKSAPKARIDATNALCDDLMTFSHRRLGRTNNKNK